MAARPPTGKTPTTQQAAPKQKLRPWYPQPPADEGRLPVAGPADPASPARAPPKKTESSDVDIAKREQLWGLMREYIPASTDQIQQQFVNHLEYTCARSRFSFDMFSAYIAVSRSVRDRLIELFNDTQEHFVNEKCKHIYYVSIEFLVGRFLRNALMNMEMEDLFRDALADIGLSLDDVYKEEVDPGLGNGGLGRLAACFLDSMATLNLPAWGYGLMYNYGMFKQLIDPNDGSQSEVPDVWLNFGDPWRVKKETVRHDVKFFGYCHDHKWHPQLTIQAIANDFLIPGFGTDNTIGLRLWESQPSDAVDEGKFRSGDYYAAIETKQRWANLTSVLYPNDNTDEGKEMRLMQEYFLGSATLRDILRRLRSHQKQKDIRKLPEFAAVQLNDTHPAIMVIELLRILVDENYVPFDEAREICQKVFSYTCHTLMPEALEQWSVMLFGNVLPRHLELVYQLNQWWIDHLHDVYGDLPDDVVRDLSLIGEGGRKTVRMANIAVVGSHTINGVAKIHSQLMTELVFKNFASLKEKKFTNMTNGVTVRRWLHHCNPGLSTLISEKLGKIDWALTGKLEGLHAFEKDPDFIEEWARVKLDAKERLAKWVSENLGVELKPKLQLFDLQVKRIHEYKRQALNLFGVIDRYLRIKDGNDEGMAPRAVIIGGKAAPGYFFAKRLIKLINNVAKKINVDPDVGDKLKLLYLPNYCVTLAELIIPGADINEQISTAGTEASGTSNMKFAYNSSVIVGTHDGANIEIGAACGESNLFFFGVKAHEVDALRAAKRPVGKRLQRVLDMIKAGAFGPPHEYECIWRSVEDSDHYLVNVDFEDFVKTHDAVDRAYQDKKAWGQRIIATTASMEEFNSDRTIAKYAAEIWGIKPCPLAQVDENGAILPPTLPKGAAEAGYTTGIGSQTRRHAVALKKAQVAFNKGYPAPGTVIKNAPRSLPRSAMASAGAPLYPTATPGADGDEF